MPASTKELSNGNGYPVTSGSGKMTRYARRRADSGVRWKDVEPAAIGECVQAVCAVGDAVLFSSTSDGGAIVITVCSGEHRFKYYATSKAEAEAHLADIENTATDAAGG
jgi:ribosomal protein L31